MTFMTIEHSGRHAWPAIEEKELPYGILRYSHGYTRRANAMTLFGNLVADEEKFLRQCECFFIKRRQKAIFRMPSFPAAQRLDSFLKNCGYEVVAPSRVLSCALVNYSSLQGRIMKLNMDEWLDAFYKISNEDLSQREVHRQLLQQIKGNSYFACLTNEDGEPICCAIAILFNGVLGIHSVVTSSAYRRRQYATGLLNALLGWGQQNTATHAFLQVNEKNTAAINLYSKMGFSTLYRYWYREKEVTLNSIGATRFHGVYRADEKLNGNSLTAKE